MLTFLVTPQTRKMVMENICFLLNQFILCSTYQNIIFCWVIHEQAIIDEILSELETEKLDNSNIKLEQEVELMIRRHRRRQNGI